jgi:hypothetical protein
MSQKTIINKSVQLLDEEVNDFTTNCNGYEVFATHTDAIIQGQDVFHKATLFYKTSAKEGASPKKRLFNKFPTARAGEEAGAGWEDRRIEGQINVVWKDGERHKIQKEDLMHDTIKKAWVYKDNFDKEFIFSENKSENPKAPQYRIYYA